MRNKDKQEIPEPEEAASPVIATQQYVSATGILAATPDKVYAKLLGVITIRFPGKEFRIIHINTLAHNEGRNWTVAALIEETS